MFKADNGYVSGESVHGRIGEMRGADRSVQSANAVLAGTRH